MEFKEFVNLVYIKGYFKTKPEFVIKMLKSSVQNPNLVAVTDSALKGYIYGDPIHSLARTMIEAGLSAEKISAFIEGLYNTEHKRTPTYKECYHGQTYREALFDKVNEKYPEVTMDEMAKFLAKKFIEIVQKAAAERDMRHKCPAPVSSDSEQGDNSMSSDDRRDIKKTITQLFRTMDKLLELSIRLLVNTNEPDDDNRREYEKYLAKFMEQNAELYYYYIALYPHLTILNQIHTLVNGLDFSAKHEVNEQGLMIHHDPEIEEYRQYLQQLARLIQK